MRLTNLLMGASALMLCSVAAVPALASTTFQENFSYANAANTVFGSGLLTIDSTTNVVQSVSGTESYNGVSGTFTGLSFTYASADNLFLAGGSHLTSGGMAFTTDSAIPGIIDIFDYNGTGAIAFSVDPSGSDLGSIVTAKIDFNAVGVPEPSSWAMMMLGFGGIGAVIRKRRDTAILATA